MSPRHSSQIVGSKVGEHRTDSPALEQKKYGRKCQRWDQCMFYINVTAHLSCDISEDI